MYLDGKEITGVYLGDQDISNAYVGDKEVFNLSPYTPDQVLFEKATAGTYSVDILADGKYEVYVIGGGAGGAGRRYKINKWSQYAAGGGSGAGFIGVLQINKGSYSISVGGGGSGGSSGNPNTAYGSAGGNSSIGSLVISYGGPRHSDVQLIAAASPSISATVILQTLNSGGNNGTSTTSGNVTVSGGASLYNGYGTGGQAYSGGSSGNPRGGAGSTGYVKIVYKGR